jgi:hypothetical protein
LVVFGVILNSAAQTNFPGNGVELEGPVSKMQSDKTERKVRKRYMKSQVYMIVYKHYIQTELLGIEGYGGFGWYTNLSHKEIDFCCFCTTVSLLHSPGSFNFRHTILHLWSSQYWVIPENIHTTPTEGIGS